MESEAALSDPSPSVIFRAGTILRNDGANGVDFAVGNSEAPHDQGGNIGSGEQYILGPSTRAKDMCDLSSLLPLVCQNMLHLLRLARFCQI
jgi:hypothetical protein